VQALPGQPDTGARFMIDFPEIWETPPKGKKYDIYFRQAELINNLPPGLLSRIAYQESRFRDDIIFGKTKSSAGAIGIMQIIPKFHPGVDPYDPVASIYYAGGFLKRLYNRFGDWKKVLAGYNWGEGNVERKGIDNAPLETKNYVAQISSDINIV